MNEYLRYVFGVLVAIFTVVLLVLGFNFIRGIFTAEEPADRPAAPAKVMSVDEAIGNGYPASYTTRGAIVADENHRQIRMIIDPSVRRLEVIKGYNNEVVTTEQISNNQESYDAFMKALKGAGFSGRLPEREELNASQASVCPLGLQYIFELAPGRENNLRTWSTSCGKRQGTFSGDRQTVESLFRKQFPNYSQVTSQVNLR